MISPSPLVSLGELFCSVPSFSVLGFSYIDVQLYIFCDKCSASVRTGRNSLSRILVLSLSLPCVFLSFDSFNMAIQTLRYP